MFKKSKTCMATNNGDVLGNAVISPSPKFHVRVNKKNEDLRSN